MNLKQLKYVLVLAKAGSFSKAASILNISQPSLSQYVKKIEEQNGVELFERSNGSVRITDAGRVYIETGRKILELEHRMQNDFLDISQNKTGSLVVGTSPFRSASMMPDVVAEFQKKYPGIIIEVAEMETHELLEAAERGEFDLCITNFPVDDRVFDYEVLSEEEMVVAVRAGCELDLKLKDSELADLKLLNGESFVMLTENQVMQNILDNICSDYGAELRKAVVVKSIESQIEMVCKGVGAALVPEGIKKIKNDGSGVNYYRMIQQIPKRKPVLIYPKNKQLTAVVRDLADIIKSV